MKIEINLDIPKNKFFLFLKRTNEHIFLEEEIDKINNEIFEKIGKLNNKKNITFVCQNTLPINVWYYIVSLANYCEQDLIIITHESLEPLTTVFGFLPNIKFKNYE